MTIYDNEFSVRFNKMVEDMLKKQMELKEKALLKAIDENDFIVGDMAIKYQLEMILPKNANVIYSPHVNPDMIYMIKKMEIPIFNYDYGEFGHEEE